MCGFQDLRLRSFSRKGTARDINNTEAGSGAVAGIWKEMLPVIVPAIITELVIDPESAAKNSTDEFWFAGIRLSNM